MGFQRNKNAERFTRQQVRKIVPPSLEEQLSHAFMALRIRKFFSHDLQGRIRDWICVNYGQVNADTVQRTWRKMMGRDDILVKREKKGRLVEYHLVQLGSVRFDENQMDLFNGADMGSVQDSTAE